MCVFTIRVLNVSRVWVVMDVSAVAQTGEGESGGVTPALSIPATQSFGPSPVSPALVLTELRCGRAGQIDWTRIPRTKLRRPDMLQSAIADTLAGADYMATKVRVDSLSREWRVHPHDLGARPERLSNAAACP
jgi:hypothetical protein